MLAETQITNLLYRYAECIDTGDLDGAAELFGHARIRVGAEETIEAAQLLRIWKSLIVLHADGTPRTKHVTTNPIIEVDEEAGTASCRSYYTVLQQTDEFPLQTIVTGRYHDRWRQYQSTVSKDRKGLLENRSDHKFSGELRSGAFHFRQ